MGTGNGNWALIALGMGTHILHHCQEQAGQPVPKRYKYDFGRMNFDV
ncbi:hypothetical protein [Tychonema sp. LEGE 07203]|nr:hypothetical protein [Tychonema sp. LEGE 07203]MBE9094965.1 hypothetical protein [Tychonema sp. LEGE 07203]